MSGVDTGETCVVCDTKIFGMMVGAGDGRGSKFAHPNCLRVRELEGHVDTALDAGTTILEGLGAARARITELEGVEGHLAGVINDLAALESSEAAHVARIAELEAKIVELEQVVTALEGALSEAQTQK